MLSVVGLAVCFGLSAFIGNGFSPIFGFLSVSSRAYGSRNFLIYSLFVVATTISYGPVSLLFTLINLCLMFLCNVVFIRFDNPLVKLSFITILYWFVSNTWSFLQMSVLVPAWKAYPFNFLGWIEALSSGIPYMVRGYAASLLFVFAFHLFGLASNTGRRSLSLVRK